MLIKGGIVQVEVAGRHINDSSLWRRIANQNLLALEAFMGEEQIRGRGNVLIADSELTVLIIGSGI